MKYLGFIPKEVPHGESKLGYMMKAGVAKILPTNHAVMEGSK
jgi:hydrogenase small subunit